MSLALAAAFLTLSASAALALPSQQDSPQAGGARTLPLRSTGHSLSLGPSDRACAAPRPGETLAAALRSETQFGDAPGDTLAATSVEEACFYLRQDGTIRGAGDGVFTGSITGCGSGTLAFSYTAELSLPDPVTGIRTSRDRGTIKPFSGTGDLWSVQSGFFDAETRVLADGSVVGVLTGQVKC